MKGMTMACCVGKEVLEKRPGENAEGTGPAMWVVWTCQMPSGAWPLLGGHGKLGTVPAEQSLHTQASWGRLSWHEGTCAVEKGTKVSASRHDLEVKGRGSGGSGDQKEGLFQRSKSRVAMLEGLPLGKG